jgi:hypothetical protein
VVETCNAIGRLIGLHTFHIPSTIPADRLTGKKDQPEPFFSPPILIHFDLPHRTGKPGLLKIKQGRHLTGAAHIFHNTLRSSPPKHNAGRLSSTGLEGTQPKNENSKVI